MEDWFKELFVSEAKRSLDRGTCTTSFSVNLETGCLEYTNPVHTNSSKNAESAT